MKEELRKYYEENIYGRWREGEKVTYELLGEDPKSKEKPAGRFNPFEVVGGELIKIKVENEGKQAEFIAHAYLPDAEKSKRYSKGSPFIICMHPIAPKDFCLEQGYAIIVLEMTKIASDDIQHNGAFYELYPFTEKEAEQTGALMAWAWGVSKVLDAVYAGLGKELKLDPDASMVTGVSRWGKATAVCGAFDNRFRMVIPACSGAGGLALYSLVSEGKTYNLRKVGGPAEYTYGKNEPLDCLQSDAERGWFNDSFLKYKKPSDIPKDQDGLVVMALDKKRYYFIIAACTGEDWVNAPAMWECYKNARKEYISAGIDDNLAVHFHKEGHAVIQEDMELIVAYFNHMYYGMDTGIDLEALKTTVFAGQEEGNAEVLRLRPYKSMDSEKIASWLKDEDVFWKWGGERFGEYPVTAEMIESKYIGNNGDCEEPDNFYPMIAFGNDGPVGHFIMRYMDGDHNIIRLGWVVVDDKKRGNGYGKRMLELGLKYAFSMLKAKKVTIGVFENNSPAYKCYKSLGFKENDEKSHITEIKGEAWKVVELEISSTDYKG